MPDTIRKAEYYYVIAPDKPGEGARVFAALRDAGVNLLAVHAFPSARKTQIDVVPADANAFLAAAKNAKLKVSKPKSMFLVEGDDRPGALVSTFTRLGDAGINVIAVTAFRAGQGRYGAFLWVDQKNVRKAAETLGA